MTCLKNKCRSTLAVMLLSLVALGAYMVGPSVPRADGYVYITGANADGSLFCNGGGWAGVTVAGGNAVMQATIFANSQVGGSCRWESAMGNTGFGTRGHALEASYWRNYGDYQFLYRIEAQLRDGNGGLHWIPINDQSYGTVGNGNLRIDYIPGTINLQFPRFWHNGSGEPRLYQRAVRAGNLKFWIDDFHGPTAGVRSGFSGGTFECLDGTFTSFNGNNWCSGRSRFHWTSGDNALGRGGSSLWIGRSGHQAGGLMVAGYGDLPDGNHSWDGSLGYPGSGCHNFQADRAGTGHATTSTQFGASICLDQDNPGAPSAFGDSAASNGAWTNVAVPVSVSASATDVGSGVRDYEWSVSSSSTGFSGNQVINNEGSTLVNARARDGVYRIGPWGPGYWVNIDRTGPTAPGAGSQTTTSFTQNNVTVTSGAATDPVPAGVNAVSGIDPSGYQYQTRHSVDPDTIGYGAWSGWTSGNSVAVSQEGHTEVRFRARDIAGNTGVEGPVRTVRIDRTAPGAPQAPTSDAITEWEDGGDASIITGPAQDNIGGSGIGSYQYQVSNDGSFTGLPVQTGDSVEVPPGNWFVRFRAVDNVGLTGPWGQPSQFTWARQPGVRRAWGIDIDSARCYFPTSQAPGGIGCEDGGLNWFKRLAN
ncbi:hypothetical protein [Miltoncostaea oceani]|uniref:hypothetical protein n=1 Tax=Miltoncostaea oceani TaxID=2843216 RepID=UPI001C3C8313|nr:hypothetical protein [Miltoncostaea oceani]